MKFFILASFFILANSVVLAADYDPEKVQWGYEVYPEKEKDLVCTKAMVLGTPSGLTSMIPQETMNVLISEVVCYTVPVSMDKKTQLLTRKFACHMKDSPKKDFVSGSIKCGKTNPEGHKVVMVKGKHCDLNKKCATVAHQLRFFCKNP